MIITISRQYGAGGALVAQLVAERLGWHLADNEFIERVAAKAGMSPEEVEAREERVPGFVDRLAWALASASAELAVPAGGTIEELEEPQLVKVTEGVVAELAREGRVVLVGRGAAAVLANHARSLHVQIVAPLKDRIARVQERSGTAEADARKQLENTDARRARYHQEYYHRNWHDPANYHMVLNTSLLGVEGAGETIVSEADRRGWKEEGGRGKGEGGRGKA